MLIKIIIKNQILIFWRNLLYISLNPQHYLCIKSTTDLRVYSNQKNFKSSKHNQGSSGAS